jgi:membrane fusion protein (multidrug efflux system)
MTRIPLPALLFAIAAVVGCKEAPPAGGGPAGGAFAVQAIVVEARIQPVSESLSLVGTVAANEMVDIKSETDGTIEEILFTEGHQVKQGDLLIRLDDTKLAASVAQAEANFKVSAANHERSKQLFKDKLISPQEFDQISAQFQANQASLDLNKRQLKDTRILPPFGGTVSSRHVSPGQVISKNTTLTWLVDLDPVKVEFNVPERYVGQLKVGQKIEVAVAAYPGRKFEGEVFFVAPFVEAATRTALVKARVPNPEAELKPGMFANLDLTLKLKEDAIVIPESSVLASGDRNIIYVLNSQDEAQIRPVKLGIRQAGLVEIASGLNPGERVVAEGLQKVRPGAKVKAAAAETVQGLPAGDRVVENGKAERPKSGTGQPGNGGPE